MRRIVTVVAALGAAAFFLPVTPSRAHDPVGPTPVTCDFLGIVVLDPGHILFGAAGDGAGKFGGANLPGNVPFVSRLECDGGLIGEGTLSGGFASCPNFGPTSAHNPNYPTLQPPGSTFNCHGLTGIANEKEAAYAIDDPLRDGTQPTPNGTHVISSGTLSSGTVPLQDVTGTTYQQCGLESQGHAIPAELDIVVTCGNHRIIFPSPNMIGFAFLPDALSDLIHVVGANTTTNPDFQHCLSNDAGHRHVDANGNDVGASTWYGQNPGFVPPFDPFNALWDSLPSAVRNAVVSANRPVCNRASAFNGVQAGFLCDSAAAVDGDGFISQAEIISCLTTV